MLNLLIMELKNAYEEISFFQKMIFPSQLRDHLDRYEQNSYTENEDVFKICKFFLDHQLNRVQKFALQAVINRLLQSELFKTLEKINRAGLLNGVCAQKNFNALVYHTGSEYLISTINVLDEVGLLSGHKGQLNYDTVVKYRYPHLLSATLAALSSSGLLLAENAQNTFKTILEHRHSESLMEVIILLHEANLFSGDIAPINFNVALNDPFSLSSAVEELKRSGLLRDVDAQANFDFIASEPCYGLVLAIAFSKLKELGLLTTDQMQETRNILSTCTNKSRINEYIQDVAVLWLLTEENWQDFLKAIVNHKYPAKVIAALQRLHDKGYLARPESKTYCKAVINHPSPHAVPEALSYLDSLGFLSKPESKFYCETVIAHPNSFLMVEAIEMLGRFNLFNTEQGQANFERMAELKDDAKFIIEIIHLLSLTGLFSQEIAQANFDVIIRNKKTNVTETLETCLSENLLSGAVEAKQNLQALMDYRHDPYWFKQFITTLEILIKNPILLSGDKAYENCNALIINPYLCEVIHELHDTGLLSGISAQDNFDRLVKRHSSPKFIDVLKLLKKESLLCNADDQPNFDALLDHKDLFSCARGLVVLNRENLLVGEVAKLNRNTIVKSAIPEDIAQILSILYRAGLLSGDFAEDNRNALINHKNHHDLSEIFHWLNIKLLKNEHGQANFRALLQHEDPSTLASVFRILQPGLYRTPDSGLLAEGFAQSNFDVLIRYPNLSILLKIFETLNCTAVLIFNESNLNAQINFESIVQHKDTENLEKVIHRLYFHCGELISGEKGQANFSLLMQQEYLACLNKVIEAIESNCLKSEDHAQTNFDALMCYSEILCNPEAQCYWDMLSHTLGQEQFNKMIEICRQDAEQVSVARSRLIAYLKHEILWPNEKQAAAHRKLPVSAFQFASSDTFFNRNESSSESEPEEEPESDFNFR